MALNLPNGLTLARIIMIPVFALVFFLPGSWSGVVAAACLHALEHNVDSLADDHRRAAALADALAELPEVEIVSKATNMLFVRFPAVHLDALTAWFKQHAILIDPLYSQDKTRLVTHRDISDDDINSVVAATKAYFERVSTP